MMDTSKNNDIMIGAFNQDTHKNNQVIDDFYDGMHKDEKDNFGDLISDSFVCDHSDNEETWEEDPGSPLLINRNDKNYQVGVISFAKKNVVNNLVHSKILVRKRSRNS